VHGTRQLRQQAHGGSMILAQADKLILQTAALDQLHAEVMLAFVFTNLVDGNDVGMIQIGHGFRFGSKSFNFCFASEVPSQNHLHRDDAVQTHLPCLIDHAHAATSDFLQQFIVPEILEMVPRPWSVVSRAPATMRSLAN
jgi:hypothetical protein